MCNSICKLVYFLTTIRYDLKYFLVPILILIARKSDGSNVRPDCPVHHHHLLPLPAQLLLPPQPAHHLADHAGDVVVHLVHLVRLLWFVSFIVVAEMHSFPPVCHSLPSAGV